MSADNIKSLMERLDTIAKLSDDIQNLNEAAKGSALRTAPTAATSLKPSQRIAQRSAATAASTGQTAPAPGAAAQQNRAALAAATTAGGTSMPAPTGSSPAQPAAPAPQANLSQQQNVMRGRIEGTSAQGGLWTDPNTFATAWQEYTAKHGGQSYRLITDPEMLSALKQIWMSTGGTELKESIGRLDETIARLYTQRESLLEQHTRSHPVYESMYSAARMLCEADVSKEQIQQIFKLVSDGADQGLNKASADAKNVSNRTILGKTGDVIGKGATAVKGAWNKVKSAISNSGPVAGFDVLIDKLQRDVKSATGGQQGALYRALQAYKDFGLKHPTMQKAVYAIVTASAATVAAMATGGALAPAGLGLLAGGLRTADRLLQGDKASSAIWSGFKAGALAAGGAALFQYFNNTGGAGAQPDPAAADGAGADNFVPDEPSGSAPAEPSGSGAAQSGSSSAASPSPAASTNAAPSEPASSAAPGSEEPVRPTARPPLNVAPTDAAASAGDAATSAATSAAGGDWYSRLTPEAKAWLGGADRTDPFILQRLVNAVPDAASVIPPELYNQAAKNAARAAMSAAGGPNLEEGHNRWIDYRRTARINELRESRGVKPTKNFYLKEGGRKYMFKLITNEGIWDSIKNAAKAAMKTVGNKITYEKLDLNWRRNYGDNPAMADSVQIQIVIDFLRKMGVTDYLIQWALQQMNLPFEQGQQNQGDEQSQDNYQGRDVTPAPAPGPTPAPAPGPSVPTGFQDGDSLLANYRMFVKTGKGITPAVRGQIGEILKTALSVVREDIEQLKMQSLVRKLI